MGNSKIPKYWLSSLSENISLKYTLDSQRLILISVSLVHDEGYTSAIFFFLVFCLYVFPYWLHHVKQFAISSVHKT